LEVSASEADPEWPPAVGSLPRKKEDAGLRYAISEYSLPVWELSLLASSVNGVDIRPYSVRQQTIQNDSWKLIRHSDGTSVLYDLSSDPAELTDLNPEARSQGVELSKELNNWLSSVKKPIFPHNRLFVPLDKQTRESLHSLGYVR